MAPPYQLTYSDVVNIVHQVLKDEKRKEIKRRNLNNNIFKNIMYIFLSYVHDWLYKITIMTTFFKLLRLYFALRERILYIDDNGLVN